MKRNKFSLSHQRLFSHDLGELVPFGLLEVLPGDSFQHNASILLRCSPLVTPVMHKVNVDIHHWFVPHRLTWEDWEDFITGGPDNDDASSFPTITHGGGSGAAVGSLADYLGVPTGVNNLVTSALPFRAYALIWNQYYRDQDLQTELTVDLSDGSDTTTNTALQNGGWEKDYLTSSRPWEQKGPSITIPLGTTAPVLGIGKDTLTWPTAGPVSVHETGGINTNYTNTAAIHDATANNVFYVEQATSGPGATYPNIRTDLSNASAITINALREAMALQRFSEARARYGSRYVEYLRYLGVRSSDARQQQPEYLGGGRQVIQFSEVLQTAASGTEPVGQLYGHGIAAMQSNRYRRFFEEHGYIISMLCVRPKTIYMNGLRRTWNRRNREDFWQMEFQHIGQQEVLNKEVRAAHASPDGIFGYQDRYDEYRREESYVSGEFRTTLNSWHFARSFGSDPALNADFVKCVPPETPFAIPSEDVIWCKAWHSVQARRLVARTGKSFIY